MSLFSLLLIGDCPLVCQKYNTIFKIACTNWEWKNSMFLNRERSGFYRLLWWELNYFQLCKAQDQLQKKSCLEVIALLIKNKLKNLYEKSFVRCGTEELDSNR